MSQLKRIISSTLSQINGCDFSKCIGGMQRSYLSLGSVPFNCSTSHAKRLFVEPLVYQIRTHTSSNISFINPKKLHALSSVLKSKVESIISQVNSKKACSSEEDLRIGFLMPVNVPTASIFLSFFLQSNVTISLLPLSHFLLKNVLHESDYEKFYNKHTSDIWRCLIVESSLNAVLLTEEYADLLSPICNALTIPFFVITQEPNILTASDYYSAKSAGYGYLNFLQSKSLDLMVMDEPNSALCSTGSFEVSKIDIPPHSNKMHYYAEVSSANAKACVYVLSSILNQMKRISSIINFSKGDVVLNCLNPHELPCVVIGLLAPLNASLNIGFPLKPLCHDQFKTAKAQFPIISNEPLGRVVKLIHAQSVWNYIRGSNLDPQTGILMCDLELFRNLVLYIGHPDLWEDERNEYLTKFKGIKQVIVTCTLAEMQLGAFENVLNESYVVEILEIAPILNLVSIPEAGVIAWKLVKDLKHIDNYTPCQGNLSCSRDECTGVSIDVDASMNGHWRILASDALFKVCSIFATDSRNITGSSTLRCL
ncbi:hypothetical protein BdWA1_000615 [Babesia duncani]|uniref:Uncharacterized protein n=1 Tax=Babesia duncani TaxID=323732 RepID=A0AAD9PMN5_9APIC|nr:hypothetical protein BdWA1_000615 [Babesia duncani]